MEEYYLVKNIQLEQENTFLKQRIEQLQNTLNNLINHIVKYKDCVVCDEMFLDDLLSILKRS